MRPQEARPSVDSRSISRVGTSSWRSLTGDSSTRSIRFPADRHTFELNVERLRGALDELELDKARGERIGARVDELAEAMEAAPKSRRWKMRARIAERKQWYEEPEEVQR